MEFSLMTEPQLGGTYEELLAAARWAEREGLASFARSDHYYSSREPTPPATDAFATLAGLARETSTIRLCVLVSPITFRHPAVIAKNAATIDEMSGGRLDLGVGTGWMDLEHEVFGLPFPPWSERFARLEEALGYLHAAFGPDPARFEGEYYRLDGNIRPKPTDTRLVVGGQGPVKTPTLAGRYADEYNHFITSPGELAPKIARMRDAARAAGRDPDAVLVSVMGPAFVAPSDEEAHERLAREAAARDMEVDEFTGRLAARGIPYGGPGQAAEALAALEAVGVDRFYVQELDIGDLDAIARTFAALRG